VGYFLLTGQHVFTGKTLMEVCGHHLHTKPAPLSERLEAPVPEDVEALILDCLEKDPGRRPQSAPALRERLMACRHRDAWTSREAQRWWDAHGPELRRGAEESAMFEKPRALEVDLKQSLSQRPTRAGPPP
jgi:serine/threonine-protein kinase